MTVRGNTDQALVMGRTAYGFDGTNAYPILVDSSGRVILAAGTLAIGKLAANSGVDIGDVDVLSIAAGTNLIGKVGIDQTTPGTTNAVVEASAAAILAALTARQATAFTNAAVSVGTATTVVLAANANRKYALIVNDSDTVVYLAIGAAAVLNSGIRLNAGGGSYEVNWTNLHALAINGISSIAAKIVTVTEGT